MFTTLGAVATAILVLSIIVWISAKNKSGLTGRLVNLGKGKADRAVEELEKGDPEALFRAAIKDAEDDIAELNELSREMKGLEFQEKEKIQNLKRQKKDLEGMLQAAIEQEDEELGTEILNKQEAVNDEIAECKEQAALYNKETTNTLKMLDARKKDREELKTESKRAGNLAKTADVTSKLQARRDGIANDSTSKSLDIARQSIAKHKSTLAANREIQESSLEARMEKLKNKGTQSTSKAKFQEMLAKKKQG